MPIDVALIAIISLWAVCGIVFYYPYIDDIIEDSLLYKKIITYFILGPLVWIICAIKYLITPLLSYVTDSFTTWLKKK